MGLKLRSVILDNGVYDWDASPNKKYLQDVFTNVEQYLTLHYPGCKLRKTSSLAGP